MCDKIAKISTDWHILASYTPTVFVLFFHNSGGSYMSKIDGIVCLLTGLLKTTDQIFMKFYGLVGYNAGME